MIDLDENFDDYEDARFYDVSLCFDWLDLDNCVTFEMVSDGPVEDKISLVESILEGYGGIAEMDDGTIINLKRFLNAYVIEREEGKNTKVKTKFNIVH